MSLAGLFVLYMFEATAKTCRWHGCTACTILGWGAFCQLLVYFVYTCFLIHWALPGCFIYIDCAICIHFDLVLSLRSLHDWTICNNSSSISIWMQMRSPGWWHRQENWADQHMAREQHSFGSVVAVSPWWLILKLTQTANWCVWVDVLWSLWSMAAVIWIEMV